MLDSLVKLKSKTSILFDIVDSSKCAAILTDADPNSRKILRVNDLFSRLTGYSKEHCVGKNCKFLQGKESDQSTILRMREALNQQIPFYADVINYRKDGTKFYNRLVTLPIVIEDHSFFIGFQIDSTSIDTKTIDPQKDLEKQAYLKDFLAPKLCTIYTLIKLQQNGVPLYNSSHLKTLQASFREIKDFVSNL